jgi:gliding motility-associated-like protein
MDANQQGISLNSSGGPALGAGGIQLECDTTTYSFLDTICLSGVGPHHVTLCKPGGNAYDYYITGIPKPSAGPPIAVSDGCTGFVYASDYIESTLTWTSISPGPIGIYNLYLSCTAGCDTTVVTSQPGYPDSVLYQVTGTPKGGCSAITVSNSVWVYFVNDKVATILPNNPVICAGQTNAILTANGTGGRQPYNYLWSTGATTQSIAVGVGTFWVRIGDVTTCPPVFDTVTVNARPRPVANFTSTNACANSNMSFTDASTISSGTITAWNWSFGDATTSSLQNPVHVYAAPGSYTVRFIATSSFGCSDTLTRIITVNPNPVASFTSNNMCYVGSVTFTNTSTISSGTISSWNWNFGDASTSTLQNPTHAYATAGLYNVTLTATSALGCSSIITTAINMQPAPAANFTAGSACALVPIAFTNTSTAATGTSPTWNWNFGDATSSTLQNPSHSYATGGNYNVTLTVTTAAGCTSGIIKTITVNPTPVPTFTANSMCYVGAASFTNTSSIASGTISSYNWNFGDATSSTLTNPTHVYSTAGTYNVTLIATSALGCSATTTVAINMQPAPIADFTSASACAQTALAFTNTSTTVAGTSPTWSWNFGDATSSTLQNPTHIYATGGTYNVTLTVTTAAGCTNSISKTVTVNPTPVPAFTANSMCYVGSVTFTNTSSIASGSISNYNWDFGDATSSTLTNPTHVYATAGTYNITLTATSALGCSATTIVPVNMQPAPVADFTSTSACAQTAIIFTNTSTTVTGTSPTWNWNFGDATSSTLQNPAHAYATGGTYNVTLTVTTAAGCTNSNTKTVTVNPTPVAAFTANSMCYIDSVTFTNTSSIASGTITGWNWNFGDATTSTLQNPDHYYASAGTYNVTLIATSALGCKDTTVIAMNMQPAPDANFSFTPACANILISFSNTSVVVPGSSPSWNWDFGDASSSALQNPAHSYLTGGTYNVTLTVTTAAGCTDNSVQSLTIDPTPVAAFTANSMCYVDSVSFTNTSSIASGSISGWNWNFGDATTSTLQNPNHYYGTAGTYNVTLIATSALGCKDTTVIAMNMQPSPNADFTANSACANASIAFNNTSVTVAGTSPTWNWNFGDASSSTLQNPSHAYAIGGTYNVTLISTTAAGCADTIVKPLVIDPTPAASFTANSMCYADSVTFTNASSISTGTISGWNWDFGDASASTLQNPTHYYATAGTYNVTLIATSTSGCRDTTIVSLNMQPAPNANFVSAGNCSNSPISFTNTSVTVTGTSPSWSWNFGDSNTSTLQDPVHYYSAGGTYNVTLIATTAAGCIDSVTKVITIDPTPVASFTNNGMCYTDSVNFTNTSTISSGSISGWNWDFGDGNTSTLQDPAHYYSISGTLNITLIATSALGCKDTTVTAINIQPAPDADFTSAGVCANSSLSLTDASTIISGTITNWSWNFGDGNTSTAQNPSHTWSTEGTYNVSLLVTAASGCQDSVIKVITVYPTPVSSFTSSATCNVDSVIFTNTSTISSGTIAGNSWNFGDGNTSTASSPVHSYSTAGAYTVTLIVSSDQGCNDTTTSVINVSSANAGFTDDGPACQGVSINFNDTTTFDSGTTITSWNWSFGDGDTSIVQNPSHPYNAGGSYTVQLIITTAAGCIDTAVHIVNIQGFPVANAGNDTSTCNNNPTITMVGSVTNAGGGQWYAGGSFLPSTFVLNPSYTATAAAISAGFDTLYLVTTSNALCPADTDQVVITYYPGPTVSAGPDVTVCKDTVGVPICSIVTSSSGVLWTTSGTGTFTDSVSVCTQYVPSTADTTAGSVTLYLVSTGNGNCFSASDTMTVFFTPTPTVAITSNDSSCAGNPVNITVNSSTGFGYWISSGTGTFSPDNTSLTGYYNPSIADDTTGSVILYFNTTNNGGCRIQHDTINITLIPSPTSAFTSISACPTFPVLFTDTSSSTEPLVSWSWNFGDGSAASTSQNPTHVYGTGGPFTVSLITTSTNGCIDTLNQVVNVYNKPIAEFDANGICLVDGTQFNDSSIVGGSTITNWSWTFGDSGTDTTQNPLHFYPATGNYNASLIVESAQGCIDTVVHTVNVFGNPTADFAADDYVVYTGQTVSFTDLSSNGQTGWSWDFGDSQLDSTSTLQNPTHIYNTGGYFDVCLYVNDMNGCTDTMCRREIVSLPPVVPSGFSPNGDGENDIFHVFGGPFKVLEFRIYNNWGECIFMSDKQSEGWDGKRKGIEQPIGVYVYTIYAITEDDQEHNLSGDVTLLR